MSIVIVHWRTTEFDSIIDGRIPLHIGPYEAIYWIPYDQTDLFVKLAMADYDVSSVSLYAFKEYFRK